MFMPVVSPNNWPVEDPLFDPDLVKMPESPDHRRAVDLIGLATTQLLDPSQHEVFRDLNWYPPDGGTHIAPDVMVVPAGVVVEPPGSGRDRPKSYRQDLLDGPPASVVVEIPSATDGFMSLRAKAKRYQALGAVVYVVGVDSPNPVILRLGPDDEEFVVWIDRPIDELGGFSLHFDGGELVLTSPDGLQATSDHGLTEAQVARAEQRADALARRLRDLGVDPATVE